MNNGSGNLYSYILKGGASAIAISMASAPVHAQDQDQEPGVSLEEIIVTARKREENVQGIPSSIQALNGDMLKEMGANNAEDYTRFIPSVAFISYTPGSNDIIFRGISTGLTDFIAQSGASLYLNETSLTLTGKQPDVRMIDIASVEAMAGPQGTLYGASAQAGIMRITTNAPDPTKFEASVAGEMRAGEHSDQSYSISGVLNIPVVQDKFAVRIAAEKAFDGGFIDNVFGHTPDGHDFYDVKAAHADWGTVDNANIVEDDWNSVDYTALRVSALWDINENWTATASFAHQNNDSKGENSYNPFVGDLETIVFNPNTRKDKWSLYSLTIEGDLGWAQLVSSTSFFERNISSVYDGTVYYKYYNTWGCSPRADQAYYYWTFPDPNNPGAGVYYAKYCFGPSVDSDTIGDATFPQWQDKFTQELRLSHEGETFDWLAGVYYEESSDNWDNIWARPTNSDYQDSISLAYWEDLYGETYPDATAGWLSTDRTKWKQLAFFGELTWHMSERLHLTAGGRWFERKNDKEYKAYLPDTKLNPEFVAGADAGGVASGKDSDFVPKVSLSWDATDDKMLYVLYTEGFRPGGTNRGRGDPSRVLFPRVYKADNVANYEIGAKTRWLDNRLQVNASYFYMKWTDYQMEVVDPSKVSCLNPQAVLPYCDQPWQKVVANAGGAHTQGFQVEVAAAPAEGWDVGGNLTWLEAQTDDEFPAASITKGLDLPNVPTWKGSAWASYRWDVNIFGGGEMYVRAQSSYTGSSDNQLIPSLVGSVGNPTLTNHSYALADLSFGLISHDDGWEVKLFVNNITDKRAEFFQNTGVFEYPFSRTGEYEHYHRIYTNRPREFGIRFSKSWD